MITSLQHVPWLLLSILVIQNNINHVMTTWPSSNNSNIQLLGLFEDADNASITTELSIHSRAMFKAAVLLSQQYNITIEGQYIEWQSAQTGGNVINALSDTCQAISSSNIVGIVGPALSREAHQIADFSKTIGIPVISYAATDVDLSDRNTYPTFSRTVPSDNSAALAIVKLFLRYNWTSCIIIYQNDAFGFNGAKTITNTFIDHNLIVTDLIVFDIVSHKIQGNLKASLIDSPTRIVILWTSVSYTSIIIQNALDSDVLGPRFTWILSSSIPLTSFNKTFHQQLIGILVVEPVTGTIVDVPINITLLNAAYQIWKQYEPESFPHSMIINSYALFAFDATWSLIQSLQKYCSTMPNNSSSCLSFSGSSFCFHRRFIHSDLLLNTINSIKFLGVSGPIEFNVNITDRINGSYYYAQNIQFISNNISFIPVLKYDNLNDWRIYSGVNVVVWPGNSFIPPTDHARLEGITLRIGVIESRPFTMITHVIDSSGQNITKLIGYIPDLIELLRNKMGFIADIQLASSNQSYSEVVRSVVDGAYDIVIGDVTVTSARRDIVGFSNGIFDNSVRIIMRKTSDVQIDLFSYLKPFSRNLWLMLLGTSVFASVLFCLLERQKNEVLQNQSIIYSSTTSLWFSIGTIMGYGVDFQARTAAGRLLTIGLYMLSLVLVASYTANLASDLTISKSKDIINGLDDLKNGKIPFNRIGIRIGTAGEDFYLREISDGNRNFYPLKSRQELYDSLLDGIIDASLMDIGVAEYITNNIYCNLTLIGDDFDKSVFGVVTPKQWLYAKDLDVNILSLKEAGLLENLRQKWFQTKICSDISQTSTAMGIESLAGLFLTFAVICVLSVLLFLWKRRCIFKNCRFILRRGRNLLSKRKLAVINHTHKTLNPTPNSSISSSNILHI